MFLGGKILLVKRYKHVNPMSVSLNSWRIQAAYTWRSYSPMDQMVFALSPGPLKKLEEPGHGEWAK